MDTFGFTQKKFLSLTPENRHRHLARWLAALYQKLTTNRVKKQWLEHFYKEYCRITEWWGIPPFSCPETDEIRPWLEKISDAIHYHRCQAGLACLDHTLLENIHTNDRNAPVRRLDCHIALDGLRSLFNVGSIFRVCEAAGFSSVILGNSLGNENEKVRKTAMGAHQWIKQEKTTDLAQTLCRKKAEGYQVIGVETLANASLYNEFDWQTKTIIVVGNEEYGISSHVLAICDAFVKIPMYGNKNSINVANTAAVICFTMAAALSGPGRMLSFPDGSR